MVLFLARFFFVALFTDNALQIPGEDLDFGTVNESTSFQCVLHVKNVSWDPVDVLDVRTSCGCAHIQDRRFTIPARATKELRVSVDLTSARQGKSVSAINSISFTVIPIVNGVSPKPKRFTVRGLVKSPVISCPNVVIADRVFHRADTNNFVSFSVQTAKGVSIEDASCLPESGSVFHVTRRDDGFYVVSFQPSQKLPSGDFHVPVSLTFSQSGHSESELGFSPLTVKLRGRIVDDVFSQTSLVSLGAISVGTPSSEDIALVSHPCGDFNWSFVKWIPDSYSDVTAADFSITEGKRDTCSHMLRVSCTPLMRGRLCGKLYFTVNVEGRVDPIEIIVPIGGFVMESQLK